MEWEVVGFRVSRPMAESLSLSWRASVSCGSRDCAYKTHPSPHIFIDGFAV